MLYSIRLFVGLELRYQTTTWCHRLITLLEHGQGKEPCRRSYISISMSNLINIWRENCMRITLTLAMEVSATTKSYSARGPYRERQRCPQSKYCKIRLCEGKKYRQDFAAMIESKYEDRYWKSAGIPSISPTRTGRFWLRLC